MRTSMLAGDPSAAERAVRDSWVLAVIVGANFTFALLLWVGASLIHALVLGVSLGTAIGFGLRATNRRLSSRGRVAIALVLLGTSVLLAVSAASELAAALGAR